MDLQLKGKVALVTGSYRGTGRVIAQTMAREGAVVLVHGFVLADAEIVAEEIRSEGGAAHAVAGDILTDAGAQVLYDACVKAADSVDILINNYGTADAGTWVATETADWIEAYEMRHRGWGRVIMLGTIGSTEPAARMPHYYASKGALATMTVSLAKELSGSGITVNIVSPGLIRTKEVEERFIAQGKAKGWGATWDEVEPHVLKNFMGNLTGRVTVTQEVADLVVFVASPRAGSLMALNMRIDGGTTALVV